jgi:outer membrane protein
MVIMGRIFVALLMVASAAWAQPVRVSLQEAVRSAVQNNHELIAARHEVAKAHAQLGEAWGYALPTIDMSGSYTRALKKPVFFFPNIFDSTAMAHGDVVAIEIGSDHAFALTFTLTQTIFNSAVFTGVGTAGIYLDASEEVYRSKETEVIASARKAYYAVLLAREVREMLRSNLENARENLQNVTVLANGGLLSEYDRIRAEVGLANIGPEVTRAENDYDLALNNLKIVMGVPVEKEIELDGTLEFAAVDEGIIREAPESVLQTNPSLSALRYQRKVNDAFADVERANYLPVLTAFGNYQFQAQKNDLRISTRDFVRSAVVGLSLSLNIFNGFRTDQRVEQATLESRKTDEQIASTEMILKTAVQSTIMTLTRARESIKAQEQTVGQAERGYRIASTRFKTGSGTQLEVNDAQFALTRARANRMQAVYEYLVASANLEQLLGRIPEYVTNQ